MDGRSFYGNAVVTVVAPSWTIATTMTKMNPPIDIGAYGDKNIAWGLHFGTAGQLSDGTEASPAVWWDASVTAAANPNEGGDVEMVQLVNTQKRWTTSAGVRQRTSSGNDFVADFIGGGPAYSARSTSGVVAGTTAKLADGDAPSLPASDSGGNRKFLWEFDWMKDFLMYRPTGGVWVTLSAFDWSWFGQAINNAGGASTWIWTHRGFKAAPASPGPSSELPIWSTNAPTVLSTILPG